MTRTALSLTALACAALIGGGCGGSSPSAGVAHLSSSSASSNSTSATAGGSSSSAEGRPTQQQMVAFSQCMRSHGVPGFPEPTEGKLVIRGGGDRNGRVSGLDPRSAPFQAARKVCAKLLPNGGVPSPAEQAKMQEAALKFSHCMRTHGVPNFPDPEFSHGGGTVRLMIGRGGPGGIDPGSPQFQAAQKACQSIMPGPKGGPGAGGNIGIGIGIGGPKGG